MKRLALLFALVAAVFCCAPAATTHPAHVLGTISRAAPGFVTLEEYGAVGDCSTPDNTPLTNALASGYSIQLGARCYLVTGVTMNKANQAIIGDGQLSVLKSTTNAPIITVRADLGATRVMLRDFKILGNNGAAQVCVANGVSATAGSGDGRLSLDNISCETVGSDGVQLYNQDTTNLGIHIGTRLTNVRVESAGLASATGYALDVNTGAEYVNCSQPNFYANQRGVGIFAGNFIGGGSGNIDATAQYAIEIGPAANDAHGAIVGWNINHNGHAIYAHGNLNGFDFLENHILYGDMYLGDLSVGGGVGYKFLGGEIDVSTILFSGCTGAQFLGVTWPGANANTMTPNYLGHTSTQFFDSNNVDNTGAVPSYISTGGVGWTPQPGQSSVVFASDANRNATTADYTKQVLKVTSGVSLTATRNLVLVNATGAQWTVFNGTTGAQSIQVIGTSGTGITLANGKRQDIYFDGTNMVAATAAN